MENKSYCPVPWTSFDINNNGEYRMCVQANTHRETRGVCRKSNNEVMTADNSSINEARNASLLSSVRLAMLKGERHEICKRYNDEEDVGLASRRITERRRYEQRTLRDDEGALVCPSWEATLVEDNILQTFSIDNAKKVTNKDGSIDINQSPILSADIRLGNLCNLKCRMCGPTESSQWKDDWYNAFGWKKFKYSPADDKFLDLRIDKKGKVCIKGFDPYSWHERSDIFNQIIDSAPNIEMIHISGGEPTLVDAHYGLLQKFIEIDKAKYIALNYNSNLTNIPDKAFEIWKHFRIVEIGGSIDGLGKVNEYIRFPSNWKKIEQTTQKIDNAPNINGWFTTTVQILNVMYITDILDWVLEQQFKNFNVHSKHLHLTMHHLHNPTYYNIQSLPKQIKNLVQTKYDNWFKTFPDKISKKEKWYHYEREVDTDYVIDITRNLLNSITKYMWANDTSKSIKEFIEITTKLDAYRKQNFRNTLPEIAEPIYEHLADIKYWKSKKNEEHIGVLFKNRHNAIFAPEFQKSLYDMPWQEYLTNPGFWECKEQFDEQIHNWIISTKENTISGLDKFNEHHIITGTTQAFDEAYWRYKDKRLRTYRGEYHYHRRILDLSYDKWGFIDTRYPNNDVAEPIDKNDWVIISMPFCGNGSVAPFLLETLDMCLEKNVPVLIDCAWFGTCYDIDIDVSHPAIKEVCFSLSKSLGMGHSRIGIRYSNFVDGPIAVTNDYNHLTLVMAKIGIHQMNNFTCDFIPNKYLQIHKDLCQEFNLTETNCMHLALGPRTELWEREFQDDDKYIKVGIRDAVKARRKGEI